MPAPRCAGAAGAAVTDPWWQQQQQQAQLPVDTRQQQQQQPGGSAKAAAAGFGAGSSFSFAATVDRPAAQVQRFQPDAQQRPAAAMAAATGMPHLGLRRWGGGYGGRQDQDDEEEDDKGEGCGGQDAEEEEEGQEGAYDRDDTRGGGWAAPDADQDVGGRAWHGPGAGPGGIGMARLASGGPAAAHADAPQPAQPPAAAAAAASEPAGAGATLLQLARMEQALQAQVQELRRRLEEADAEMGRSRWVVVGPAARGASRLAAPGVRARPSGCAVVMHTQAAARVHSLTRRAVVEQRTPAAADVLHTRHARCQILPQPFQQGCGLRGQAGQGSP